MESMDDENFRLQDERDRVLERAWDRACAHETRLMAENPWGDYMVAAYCIGDKNHLGGHVYSTKTHMTPDEIMRDTFPDWERRPF